MSITSSQNPTDAGDSITFTATGSSGTGSYTYQWYVNDSAVSGATSSTYSTSFSAGTYSVYVILTDGVGDSATSNTVIETVHSDPSVTIKSSQNPTDAGDSITFTASTSGGTGAFTYTWYVDGSAESSTSNTFSYTFSSTGTYYVNVTAEDSIGNTAKYSYTETVAVNVTESPTPSVNIT